MNLPAWCFTSTRTLPEQTASSSAGVTPLASPFRKILAPGGSDVRWREASESSRRTGSTS